MHLQVEDVLPYGRLELSDFFFQFPDELFCVFIVLTVRFVGEEHGVGNFIRSRAFRVVVQYLLLCLQSLLKVLEEFMLFIGHGPSSFLRCIRSIPWACLLHPGCIIFPSCPLPAGTGGRRDSLDFPHPAGCGRSSATGRRSSLPGDGGPGPDG